MYKWLLLGIVVLICALVYMQTRVEGFGTVDTDALLAQHQQLGFEGEQRYNPVARLQDPTQKIPKEDIDYALTQVYPIESSGDDSNLVVRDMSRLGGADDGSGKMGPTLEQTGILQDKVRFCESITSVNCNLLNDPLYAECGMCHKNGENSTGKPHRGGMFISSSDQIRANSLAKSTGSKAVYTPTIGTCDSGYFTLMKQNCDAREQAIACEMAGAPSSGNQCGQCYGSAGPMLYVGPKPVTFTAYLNVSHPGLHHKDGMGITVTNSKGDIVSAPSSSAPVLDPTKILIEVTEGERIQIQIYGAPAIWAAWLSSEDDTRSVSIDIGVTAMSPSNAYIIAGDKYSKRVNTAMSRVRNWSEYSEMVPSTVLWYQRHTNIIPPAIVMAWYGTVPPSKTSSGEGMDVTDAVKELAANNSTISISKIPNGDPTSTNILWVMKDSGATLKATSSTSIDKKKTTSNVAMNVTIPATLVGPFYEQDEGSCAAGPMVYTEIGAGLMGSNSCYDIKGKFNPSVHCISQLFISAGGTEQGKLYPSTDADAMKLVVGGPDGKPSLDETVAFLNDKGNIAIYGVDSEGGPVEFKIQKQNALDMLGISITNPCEGPTAETGPHSAECLDYLWKTSGGGASSAKTDPADMPYEYCTPNGEAAPIINRKANFENIEVANDLGGITSIRKYYNNIYNRTQDSSNFDVQADAIRLCYGANMAPAKPEVCIPKPVIPNTTSSAPSANCNDWIALANSTPWQLIDGGIVQASIDDNNNIIGVTATDNIYDRRITSAPSVWRYIHGSLAQMDGKNGVYVGVNRARFGPGFEIWRYMNGDFSKMPGAATWVSIGADGDIWCVNEVQEIYRWNGGAWVRTPGSAIQITVGDRNNIWVTNGYAIYKWNGSDWTYIPSKPAMRQLSVNAGGTRLAGFGYDGNVYGWTGKAWSQIGGNFDGSVSVCRDYLLATNRSNQTIYIRKITC